jgi:hypothetical protein
MNQTIPTPYEQKKLQQQQSLQQSQPPSQQQHTDEGDNVENYALEKEEDPLRLIEQVTATYVRN